jgi:hypothetical protein
MNPWQRTNPARPLKPAPSTQAIVRPLQPAPHTEAYRKREEQKDRLREELMRARPSKGLSTLIAARWKEALFMEVLSELVPEKFIPAEIRALLKDATETDKKVGAFIRVLFAQGEKAWFARAQAESPQTFGLSASAMRAVREQSKRLKLGRRISRRGRIDQSYNWWRITPHEVPELGTALGLTPVGLRKKCTRLGIKLTASTIRQRAASLCPVDAITLLKLQLKLRINRDDATYDRLRKNVELWRLEASSEPLNSDSIVTPAGSRIRLKP